ncbi:hypothetical protein ACKKBF_B34395 [Auxenochlorella protothecoides x Auxenochlorella symbiontica]
MAVDGVESQGMSLATAFRDIQTLLKRIDGTTEPSSKLALQREALSLINATSQRVESSGLFSTNEEVDDLATADIRYLLLPAYRGSILSSFITESRDQRKTVLLAARASFSAFLLRLVQYKMLAGTANEAAAQILDQEREGEALPLDAATVRQRKITFFKRRKELAALLEREGTTEDADLREASDEDARRRAWLLHLESAALAAIDDVAMIDGEVPLLKHASSLPTAPGGGPVGVADRRRTEKAGELLQGLRGVVQGLQHGERQQVRDNVFKPSHILPTMSVEQFGELEARAAAQRAQREEEAARERARAEAGRRSDDEDDDAAAKQKERSMDDWKDDNPRGWGNSKLRPCG